MKLPPGFKSTQYLIPERILDNFQMENINKVSCAYKLMQMWGKSNKEALFKLASCVLGLSRVRQSSYNFLSVFSPFKNIVHFVGPLPINNNF